MGSIMKVPLSGASIAVVEDDPLQAGMLAGWVSGCGASVDVFGSGTELLGTADLNRYDTVLLDWMMPGALGDEVLQELRRRKGFQGGILFLTSRDAEEDLTFALLSGADDYLYKPVRRVELLARIDAVRRRYSGSLVSKRVVEIHPYVIDPYERKIFCHGKELNVTTREFDLASYMFQRVGVLVRRDQLLASIWGLSPGIETRTVDMHVSRVRRALNLRPPNGFRLSAIHNVGYRLERVTNDEDEAGAADDRAQAAAPPVS